MIRQDKTFWQKVLRLEKGENFLLRACGTFRMSCLQKGSLQGDVMKPFAEGKDYGLVQGYRAIRHTEKPKLEGLPMGRACHVHGDNAVCHGCCRGQGPQDVRLHARKVFRRVPLPCVVEGLEKAWHAAVEVLAGKSKPHLAVGLDPWYRDDGVRIKGSLRNPYPGSAGKGHHASGAHGLDRYSQRRKGLKEVCKR